MKKLTFLICLVVLAGCGRDGGRKGAPVIHLSAPAIQFTSATCGSNPESQTLQITNAGKRTLAWSVSNLPSWLRWTPESGAAPATVTAAVDAAGLACGETYSHTVEIAAAGASNAPFLLTVTLTLPAPEPAIGIDPETKKVAFTAPTCGGSATGAAPAFRVLNTGSGSFNWSATTADPWIEFAPLSGSAGASVTIEAIDTSNLPCGQTSSGTIEISSAEAENAPVTVTVEVIVPSAASIHPSTEGLGLFAATCKADPLPQEFTLQNRGGTPLGWSAALAFIDGAGWASVDITGGTVAAGETSPPITVTVDPSGLSCGQGYAATLTLIGTSGGNNVTAIEPKTIRIGFSHPVAWEHQNPKPTSRHINDVTFSEEGIAWAVGDGGAILRSPPDSPDYGNNWIPVVGGMGVDLRGIRFISPLEGWIVGNGGVILHTTNGGATWESEESPTDQDLQSVYFLDAAHGWAVGNAGTVLFRDGGGTWVQTAASGTAAGPDNRFTRVFMNDATHGWITVENQNESLLWTNNNWATIIPQDQKSAGQLYSVFFLPKDPNSLFPDRLEGWAVGAADKLTGNGSILHIASDTGTAPWTTETMESGTAFTLLDLFMSGPNLGWAAGGDDNTAAGTILQWDGAAWLPVMFNAGDPALPPPKYFRAIASGNGNGIAAGLSGMVFTSFNGTEWDNVSGPSMNHFKSVGFALDGVNGWAVGDAGTVLTTSTGGSSWIKQSAGASDFNSLSVVSATDAWAVTNNRQIYHYSSGSWGLHTTLAGSFNLKGVHFGNANNGWAVGRIDVGGGVNRHVYYYNGTSWSAQTNFCDASVGTGTINGVYFIETTNGWKGWAVGNNRWIGYTTNGGADWTCAQVGPAGTNWNSIHFISETTGWAVGSSGRIYKTTDGGGVWVQQTSSTTSALFGVRFSDANNGWIVGASGTVLYTQNGGSDWAAQPSVGTNQSLNGVYFTPGGLEGWAVGNTGVILHTFFGGVN